jgi:hypothetical protein
MQTSQPPMDKELEARLKELEKRLARLENQDQQAEQAAVIEGSNLALSRAQFAALYSMVFELSIHEGISLERCQEHFEERVRHYRDYFLRIAENINPNWAGQIDVRDQSEMPDSESYSPLFP